MRLETGPATWGCSRCGRYEEPDGRSEERRRWLRNCDSESNRSFDAKIEGISRCPWSLLSERPEAQQIVALWLEWTNRGPFYASIWDAPLWLAQAFAVLDAEASALRDDH